MAKFLIFKQFLREPSRVGALRPSSPKLCRQMIADTTLVTASAVAELGPGTGVVTKEILAGLGNDAKFFAVELDEKIYCEFSRLLPDVTIIRDSAENLQQIMKQQNIEQLDVIVSGLPWAAFPTVLQENILNQVVECLVPGGHFTTFAYLQGLLLPAGKRFRKKLHDKFTTVNTSPIIWANLPPAIVYHCQK